MVGEAKVAVEQAPHDGTAVSAPPVRRVGDHADHLPDPTVKQMRSRQPLLDRADAAGREAPALIIAVTPTIGIDDEDAYVVHRQLLLQDHREGVQPTAVLRRRVEEVTGEVVEEQAPQAQELHEVVLRGLPYSNRGCGCGALWHVHQTAPTAAAGLVVDATDEHERAAVLNAMLASATAYPRLTDHAGTGWHVHYRDDDQPLGRLLLSLISVGTALHLAGRGMHRLRRCDVTECTVIFADTSRTGRQRYCSQRCANRDAVRRHRARSASGVS